MDSGASQPSTLSVEVSREESNKSSELTEQHSSVSPALVNAKRNF